MNYIIDTTPFDSRFVVWILGVVIILYLPPSTRLVIKLTLIL